MEESIGAEGLKFKWGKKKGLGGKNKDVQFYESFTYDGDEYRLYDCVFVGDASEPDTAEPFVGMIIKIWEHSSKRAKAPRQVKLLWFFKPSEISPYLEGVPDVLANELFLASGEGLGVANVNQLEAIGGKCSVICISKDKRNPQPAVEEIKSTDFVFRRAFDVGSCKVLDTIDDKIAGVDIKFILNRAGSKKEATAVPKIEAYINGNPDSFKPNGFLASASRVNNRGGEAQENQVEKQFTKQKSMPAEEIYNNSCEASGYSLNHPNSKTAQVDDVKKQLSKQNSIPSEARYCKDLNGLDDRPQKKQKLDDFVTVSDRRNTNMLQNISSDGKKNTESFKRPRDKVTEDEAPPEKLSFIKKNHDLGVSDSEGKDAKTATEIGLSKKLSFDGKLSKRSENMMLADDFERNYQVIEVNRKPDAANSTWYRPLPWEESMREAEKQERLVLLQNLDPTYTCEEVQDIVYSALKEQCTARIIERTTVTISHIGQALVIFHSKEAAKRAIRRLDEGCLLLSNGRPLVAAFAKINPPGKPSSFAGHIKPLKPQMRREMRDAVATSHCSQPNTIEFEMALEWCLHRARSDQTIETISKRQLEERKSLRINFKPKRP